MKKDPWFVADNLISKIVDLISDDALSIVLTLFSAIPNTAQFLAVLNMQFSEVLTDSFP